MKGRTGIALGVGILFVLLGILAYFGVFDPGSGPHSKCTLSTGLHCEDYFISKDFVLFQIQNGFGKDIILSKFVVTETSSRPLHSCETTPGNITISNGQSATINLLSCPIQKVKVGKSYRYQINATYQYVNSSRTHTTKGDLFDKVRSKDELNDEYFADLKFEMELSKSLNSCGDGVCEDYELMATCERDCGTLENHTYRFCRDYSWSGVTHVRIVGTNISVSDGGVYGPDLQPRPQCGYDGIGTGNCFQCYSVTDVHEPIWEISINSGAGRFPLCHALIRKYFIDGVELGCDDTLGSYFRGDAYYPWDEERFILFKRIESSTN